MGYVINADGNRIMAPTFVDSGGYNGKYLGFRWEVAAGTTDIYDYDLQTNIKLQGGYRKIAYGLPADGDYMEMSVVDKDNFTGMFDGTNPTGMNPGLVNLGLTVGVDVLEIFKYVYNEQADASDVGQRYVYEFGSATFIPAGLYLRSKYVSTGTENLILKCGYKGYVS